MLIKIFKLFDYFFVNTASTTKSNHLERHTIVKIAIFLPCYSLFDLSFVFKSCKMT